MKRIESRVPRVAELPYSAQAIASRIVVLPDPFAPMMPVSPISNGTTVSACWRKFCRWSRWSRTLFGRSGRGRRRRLERLGLAQVVEAECNESVAIDVARHDAPLQMIADRVGERGPSPGRAAGLRPDDLGP